MNGSYGSLLARYSREMDEKRNYRRTTLQQAHGKILSWIHPIYDCLFLMNKDDGIRLFLVNNKLVEFDMKELVQPNPRDEWEPGCKGAMWQTELFHPYRSIHHFHPGKTVHGVHGWADQAGSSVSEAEKPFFSLHLTSGWKNVS